MHRETQPADSLKFRKRYRFRKSPEDLRLYETRVIVAGSRNFDDWDLFVQGMRDYVQRDFAGRESELIFITGEALTGADALIIRWCEQYGYPWVGFPAPWDNLDAPGAVIRHRRDGTPYNVRAGYDRNRQMAVVGTNLIAWWDGVSGGTQDMIAQAERRNLPVCKILITSSPKKVNHAREPQSR